MPQRGVRTGRFARRASPTVIPRPCRGEHDAAELATGYRALVSAPVLCVPGGSVSTSSIQTWVAIVGGLLTAILGISRYFNYKSKRDRLTAVGAAFSATVQTLASDNEIDQIAAAVLLRRFFDRRTEQGKGGAPYKRETVEVIAGVLRQTQCGPFQKALADSLRYAKKLISADLQRCNLTDAYLGRKLGDTRGLNLSNADLFGANCTGASFREVVAIGAVFYQATLEGAVFVGAKLQKADFRNTCLKGARFSGAKIEGARFQGARDMPSELSGLLSDDLVGLQGAEVGNGELVQ